MAIELVDVRVTPEGGVHPFDLSLTVREGEFVALVGPARSGKTLILEVCAGIIPAEQGSVRLMGQDLAEIMDEEWGELRTQVGTVLERPGLLSNMTMFNNVALPLRYHQTELTETDIQSRVMAQLEALGISALKDMFPAQLNQGEIRCAAIARALVSEPRIMLLDEPVSGLDAHMTRRLAQHLSYYRQKMPLTILATMRSYSELLEIVDRVILLNDGQIQAVGTPAEIAKSVTSDFRGYVTPGFGLS